MAGYVPSISKSMCAVRKQLWPTHPVHLYCSLLSSLSQKLKCRKISSNLRSLVKSPFLKCPVQFLILLPTASVRFFKRDVCVEWVCDLYSGCDLYSVHLSRRSPHRPNLTSYRTDMWAMLAQHIEDCTHIMRADKFVYQGYKSNNSKTMYRYVAQTFIATE